ncbi:MAG: GNAT family N-acetyltransferase [Myxococcota bacterium]
MPMFPDDHRQGPVTERMNLRAFEAKDAAAYLVLRSHPDILRFTGETPLKSIEQAKEAIEQYPDWAQYGFGRWACELRSTGQVVGFCGLKCLPELDEEIDLGYRLLPEVWGQGLATEGSLACMHYGREVLGLRRIIGIVDPLNHRSVRVLEKAGLTYDCDITYFETKCKQYLWEAGDEKSG